jgi:methyltransferase (TIGR00027 family)
VSKPLIRSISDTARWVAVYRARESERPDAVFRDPLARRLAGERGEQIAASLPFSEENAWSFVARTYAIDRLLLRELGQGIDLVVNLAAGLDARPYRLPLPAMLQWVEVDLPEILDYKEDMLRNEKPVCTLERVRLDLSDVSARRQLFAQLGQRATKALLISEGLLIYLTADQVSSLAHDLAAPASFRRWILDIASPGLLRLLQQRMGFELAQGQSPLKFAPAEGPEFFTPLGWKPVEVHSILKTAARLKRLPFRLRLFAMLPESKGRQGSRPWSGVCLFAKS